jgi:putative copper export protein
MVEALATWINSTPGIWAATETVHFIGLAVLFGVVLLVNLRMLGMIKSVPFADLHLLLPLGLAAVAVNFFTGMIFFIAIPGQYTNNLSFYWKMVLLLPATVSLLYLTVSQKAWALGPGDEAPVTTKVIAASSIILWLGVLYFGRMLPYIGNSF